MYSDYYLKQQRRVPVILPILIGIAALVAVVRFGFQAQRSHAIKRNLTSVQVANVFPSQITVIWQTNDAEQGWLIYGKSENDLTESAYDDRDLSQKRNEYKYHIATMKDLEKNTRYFFTLTNGKEILETNNQSLFSVKTIDQVGKVNTLKPAYGKLERPNNTPAENTIVLLSVKNTYPLATITKSTGEWLIPLNYLIDKQRNTQQIVSGSEVGRLYFFDENEKEAKVIAKLNQMSPVSETVVLGQTYSLTEQDKVLAAVSKNKTYPVAIDYPKENAVISGARPLIKGVGVPSNSVKASLFIQKSIKSLIDTVVKVDAKGEWNIDLAQQLEPNDYKLTIETTDATSKEVSLNRLFAIRKSGVSVLGVATPSGTLTPTVTEGPTATPTSILLPTNTPTTVVASTSTTPPPPVSGNSFYPLALASIALIIFGAGLMVVF